MATNQENLSGIRRRLGNPNPQAPDDGMLLNFLVDQLLHHQAQLQNTRNHWGLESYTLTTSPGQEDYIVTGAQFGRPFLVYTQDLTNPYHNRCEIPFTLMQDADQRYQGSQQTGSASQWSAAEMVFYRRGTASPAWYARPVPIPNASGDYVVWFEQNYEFGSLGDSPGLASFHHLVRVQTAMSGLPHCEWGAITIEGNPKAWELKTRAIRDSLVHDEAIYQKQFDAYKAMGSRDGVTERLGYGEDFESEWGYGGGRMVSGWGI